MEKILVTGAGGIAGVNFVRSIKASPQKFSIIGCDFNKYYLQFAELDERINSPKHSDPQFIELMKKLIDQHQIQFLHAAPASEALVIAQNLDEINTKTLLPDTEIIAKDKLTTQKELSDNGISVAETKTITTSTEIEDAYTSFEGPVWIRAKSGAGGNLSLLCNSSSEARNWIDLWVLRKKAVYEDFMFQEYLPGRNLAWDSLWFEGKLVASFTRERLEYPFKHISPSGITGTPTVSKILVDEKANVIGKNAIESIDKKPHGSYAVDLKGDSQDNWYVTEIDSGKFHTTTPLWGYISTKIFKQEPEKNLPYLYVMLGLGKIADTIELGYDIYPENTTLLRHIDCGDWILDNKGTRIQVL